MLKMVMFWWQDLHDFFEALISNFQQLPSIFYYRKVHFYFLNN